MKITRKGFLLSVGGTMVGVPMGVLGERYFADRASPARGAPDEPAEPAEPAPPQGLLSFSQSGEDVVAGFIFDYLTIRDITYLDIGAWEPILLNNTYYFYLKGYRGVLVEPNVTLCEKLQAVRPADKTLVAGIGVTGAKEADYYVMSEPSWSTFSEEEAEHQVRITNGQIYIKEVRRMPLLNINEVMREHFKGAPAFVSIDAEGWHLAILESIDYERFRPKVICVETLVSGSNRTIPEIPAFMEAHGYVARGGSFVNAIFVDSRIL